jgi:Na+-translocating ferredoxin:NAD+ oxidoreductase subunit G
MAEQTAADAGAQSIKPTLIIPVIAIALCAGAALSLVNAVTAGPIAEARKAEKAAALSEVMPGFENDPTVEVLPAPEPGEGDQLDPGQVRFYVGRDAMGNVTGWGIESATDQCYSSADGLSLVFGVDPDGKVQGIRFLKMLETPGLGTKATAPDYLDQYQGHALGEFDFRVGKDGGDIDAITGATVTSRAVSTCVEQGLKEFQSSYKGKAPPPPATAAAGSEHKGGE